MACFRGLELVDKFGVSDLIRYNNRYNVSFSLFKYSSRKHEAGQLKEFSRNGLTAPKLYTLIRCWVGAVMPWFRTFVSTRTWDRY